MSTHPKSSVVKSYIAYLLVASVIVLGGMYLFVDILHWSYLVAAPVASILGFEVGTIVRRRLLSATTHPTSPNERPEVL
jgi:uncharacterized membrane protein YfcA